MQIAKMILTHLLELFGEQSRTACFEVSKRIFHTKMREGQSVHDHCLNIIKDIEQLEKLGMSMSRDLQVDLILQSLSSCYGQFIMNYNMNKLDYTLPELLNMLVVIEDTLKSSKSSILSVEHASRPKRKSLGKKKKPAKKLKKDYKNKKEAPKQKSITEKGKCFHYNVAGH